MKILYVEDEIAHVVLAQRTLEENIQQKFELIHAETMKDALRLLDAEPDIDLVLSDLRLPDGTGLELLKRIRERKSAPAVVLVTGQGDQEVAVAALKAGAADYLVKQSDYLHRLPVVISNAIAQNRLLREQDALRQAEIKYQSLVEQISAVVFLDEADENETALYISPRVEQLTGYTPADWYAMEHLWIKLLHPDDRERIVEADKRSHEMGTRFLEEYRFLRRDGGIVWVKEDTNLIRDKSGDPLYWQGILLDITKEKESLEIIRKSEERFRRIFHASPIATCVVRMDDGQFIDANQAYLDLIGKSFEDLLLQNSVEMGLWRDEKERSSFIEQLHENGTVQGIEHQFQNMSTGTKDTIAYYESIELGGQICILAMFYDVTEEKKAQKELQAERDFALQVLNNMGQGLTVTTRDGKFRYVNPAYAGMLGYKPEEILERSPSDFAPEASQGELENQRALRREGITSTYETRLLHKDLHEVPALITGVPRWDEDVVTGTIAVITDLTERKETEEALARQVKELTVLHAVAIAEAESESEDEIIERATKITGQIYPELCGFLLLNEKGDQLTPHPYYIGANAQNWHKSYPITDGITGQAVSLDRIIRIGDVTKEAGYIEIASGVRSELCIPIRINGRVIGVLNVESKIPDAFAENDERFLKTIASSVGTALERLRFFREEQRRSRELNALYQATKSLAQSLKPEIIAQNLITTMDELLGYEFASLYLVDDDGEHLIPMAISRKAQDLELYEKNVELLQHENRVLGQGIVGWVAQHGQPIRTGNVSSELRYLHVIKNIQSELCVPLVARGRVVGTLNVESTQPHAYSEKDESLLTALANSAAISFENARLYKSELTRREQAENLRVATASLSTASDLNSLYQIILDSAAKLIPYEYASVLTLNQNVLETVAERSLSVEHRNMEMIYKWDNNNRAQWEEFWRNSYKPIVLADIQKSENRPLEFAPNESTRSWMGAPIVQGENILGLISFASRVPNFYTDEHSALIQTFASQAGIAIEKARLFETEKKHHHEAELLREATATLTASLELNTLLATILRAITEFIPNESCSIFLENPQDEMVIVATQGMLDPEKFIGKTLSKTNKWHKLAETQQARIIGDVWADPLFEKWDGAEHIRGWMGIPMKAQDKVIGYINLDSRRVNAFTKRDATIAQTFANSAAIALGNARLYQDALRASERRAVLHRISQDIVRFGQDFEQIYVAIHEAAMKLMACDAFIIALQDESKTVNTPVYTVEAGTRLKWESVPADAGITATVINEGKTIILLNDAEITKRDVIHFGSDRHVQSLVAVPMRISNKIIGMISAQCYEPYAYGMEEQALLEMLATHAATAIENGRLFESEQKRRQEAENLRQAATAISSTLDPGHVLAEILNALKQVIYYDHASVFLHEGEWLRLAICQGFSNAEKLSGQKFPADDKLFQQIKADRRPTIIADAQKDQRFNNWGDTNDIHGWMSVPLIARGEVMGYITLDNYQVGAYSEGIIDTAMAFANQAAVTLENARLFQEQIKRSKIIEVLADIANEIATTREVMPVLDQITRRALDMLSANHVAIYLLQDDQVTLKTVAAHGMYQRELLGHTIRVGDGITGNIFLKAKAEIINDTTKDPRRVTVPGTPRKEEKLESLMSSPLILRGRPIGVINAWRLKENGLFNESELNFLVGIAHQVSICIESGRLFQETSRQAQEAAAIAEVGRDISATLQLDAVLERIASYAMDLLHSETSAVYLAEGNILHATAALGIDAEAIKNDPLTIGRGILGNIASQNKGEIVNDTYSDPRTITVKGTEKNLFEHLMGVPIVLKDKHTGLLAVWRSGAGTDFAARELDFLTSLARQTAVAIENARLYDETQRRVKELEIIDRVSTSLRIAHSVEEMLPILLDETLGLLNTPHGSIWMYDHTSNQLVQKMARGAESKLRHMALSPVEGIVGRTFTSGEKYISPNLKNDPLLFELNRESITPGLAGICVPIQSTVGPVGALMVAVEQGRQITEAINLLTILAEITGNSIHRVQLYEQSQKQVKRLTTLRDIDAAIASSFDLRLTLNILMDQTLNHLNVDAVDIGLYHPDIQSITYVASVGFQTAAPTRPQLRLSESLAGQVVIKQSILHVTDLQNAREARNELLLRSEGFVTYIGIPLIVKGQIKGVFEIFHRRPLSPTLDWMEFLHTLAGQAAIAIDSSQLFENLQRSNQELMQAYDTTLEGWARALELRDRETEGHTRRVTELTMLLARFMEIGDSELVNIHRGVLLHDIGKMGVPDHILKKTGELDASEWVEMRQHPIYAYNLLSPISYLRRALDIPYCHHEHWDGSGYPRGLKGEQIPLSARIFSVVDIWDALLSDRPYRKAWPRNKVVQYLKDVAGTILDPNIVEIFFRMMEGEKNETG